MTRTEAHALLDAARAGVPVSEYQIRLALQATGDLGACRAVEKQDEAPNERQ